MSGFLTGPGPRWFTIAAHRPFLVDLAAGVWNALAPLGPEAVADAVVLLPNRRAARALTDAFLACSDGRPILPPQMRALGDLDEGEPPFEAGQLALDLPPAISPERRRFELAGIVADNTHLLDRSLTAVSALDLADALARFLDACQIEEISGPSGHLAHRAGESHMEIRPQNRDQTVSLETRNSGEILDEDLGQPASAATWIPYAIALPHPGGGRSESILPPLHGEGRDAERVRGGAMGSPIDLDALVDGDFAQHWRRSADFLRLATEAWPARLAELGLMDLTARRVALIRALQARWTESPPAGVLIAAGSTGSTSATADLLAAIALAPQGCVVLPGLDLSLADKAWAEVGDQHPQGALKRLLDRARIARGQVAPWPGSHESIDAGRWRRRIVSEALRPAESTADWLEVIGDIGKESDTAIAEGLAGLALMSARGEDEAAAAAALMLREALRTPDRTAALVTPDAALARRVTAALARWNVTPDSSVGQSLAASPLGVLASLIARQSADPVDPVTLLAIVKHPLTRLDLAPETLGPAREKLERRGLRGARPGGWQALRQRLAEEAAALDLADRLEAALALAQTPFSYPLPPLDGEGRDGEAVRGGVGAAAAAAARALAHSLEALAAGPGGTGALWAGQAGEAVAALLESLMDETQALPPVTPAGFRDLLAGLLARGEVRPGGASHPRLKVLGVLEARLISADLLILAGLEEGTWPQLPPIDPFLSRPMRERLGLPAPERRIGLAAHDFAQAACAPQVVLLHTERRGGSPTVQSRWLWRLRTLIAGAGLDPPGRPEVLAWARALDAPLADPPASLKTATRPKPAPPVAVRPRQLPVTDIEKWIRDPYAIYARRILGLRPLDPPDAPVEAMARGSAIHRAFERLAGVTLEEIEASGLIEAFILEALREAGMPEARMARELALARNVAPWVLAFETRRRPGATLLIEQQGRLTFAGPAGPFTVTARADRIEAREALADILDFKTGAAPSQKQVDAGLSPQLTLTAAILAAGGFADLGPVAPGELLYVRVRGGREPGEELPRAAGDAAALAAAALAGLKRRVARFDEPASAYVSKAVSQFVNATGDFDHLARVWEWHVIGEAEPGE